MACNNELRENNKPYPRTCADCKLGPCRKLGYKPVQTLQEAQAEIARLQAEIERLEKEVARVKAAYDQAKTDRDTFMVQSLTAWNDAIEAAAQVANDYDHHEIEEVIRALKRSE